jgi:hypothetical protein
MHLLLQPLLLLTPSQLTLLLQPLLLLRRSNSSHDRCLIHSGSHPKTPLRGVFFRLDSDGGRIGLVTDKANLPLTTCITSIRQRSV